LANAFIFHTISFSKKIIFQKIAILGKFSTMRKIFIVGKTFTMGKNFIVGKLPFWEIPFFRTIALFGHYVSKP